MVLDDPIEPFPTNEDRDAFGHWLSGFVDGEACFQIWTARVGRWSRGGASFIIDLRADDVAVLRLIQSFWQCGKLRATARTNGSREKRVFGIHCLDDLERVVIPHFDRYPLRAKKARDFIVWRRGIILLNRIAKRPRRGRGKGRGTLPKWTAPEWTEYTQLVAVLKKQRQFETGGASLALPPEAEQPSLF
jgi:hypothetical protein